jgi:hypothetical protein
MNRPRWIGRDGAGRARLLDVTRYCGGREAASRTESGGIVRVIVP